MGNMIRSWWGYVSITSVQTKLARLEVSFTKKLQEATINIQVNEDKLKTEVAATEKLTREIRETMRRTHRSKPNKAEQVMLKLQLQRQTRIQKVIENDSDRIADIEMNLDDLEKQRDDIQTDDDLAKLEISFKKLAKNPEDEAAIAITKQLRLDNRRLAKEKKMLNNQTERIMAASATTQFEEDIDSDVMGLLFPVYETSQLSFKTLNSSSDAEQKSNNNQIESRGKEVMELEKEELLAL